MEVNPPKSSSAEVPMDALLHSITLPFSKAVYRVGDVDSIAILGLLVNGDTIDLDPADITWTGVGAQLPILIDSAGVLRVQRYTPGRVNVTASYRIGEVTRTARASIYVSQSQTDIKSLTLTVLDTSSVGYMLYALGAVGGDWGILNVPNYSLVTRDVYDTYWKEVPNISFATAFLTSDATGLRVPLSVNVAFQDTLLRVTNLITPRGKYWLGISAYLYGKSYIDSVPLEILPMAEFLFSANTTGGQLTIGPADITLQPCAFFLANNTSPDTIEVELSQPIPDRTCGGKPTESGTIIVPPGGSYRIIRRLGYSAGQTVTWSATAKGKLAAPMTGVMHFVSNED